MTTWLNRLFPETTHQVGTEPDYRFTLANERTFLAWIRTALALSAGGLAALHLIPNVLGSEVLGILLLVLSVVTATSAYRRWSRNEIAMRLNQPLRPSHLPHVMALATAAVALLAALLYVFDQ